MWTVRKHIDTGTHPCIHTHTHAPAHTLYTHVSMVVLKVLYLKYVVV
jgi:hypothetical protein